MATKKTAPKSHKSHNTKKHEVSDIYGMLDYFLVEKSPITLPASVKEWIVKYLPWFWIIFLAIFLPFALGVTLIALPFTAGVAPGVGPSLSLAFFVFLAKMVLIVAALPGLFKRTKKGWTLLFYLTVLTFVYGLVQLNVINAVVSAVISLYVLFQIRSHYKA
jgi:hypothetical protein